jgi:cystathionine beta-lyase
MNKRSKDQTRIVHSGRHPMKYGGVVNPPVMHASTILSKDIAAFRGKHHAWEEGEAIFVYGRYGTASQDALAEAMCDLEGGFQTMLFPSGLAACSSALIACVKAGDHVLMPDTIYGPFRLAASRLLARFGVETQFYDPLIGAGIERLFRNDTSAVVVEAPGSLTFEMQDIPAICAVAGKHGALSVMDNTWATPYYFKPIAHGVDLSVQAATKYIVGHSDAMLGAVTAGSKAVYDRLLETHRDLGMHAAPDDAYLGQRGLRTLAMRLKQHWESGVALAEWIARQPEVERVLHPALPADPGYPVWKRDFTGASGLFGVVLKPMPETAFAALLDHLELYGIGGSWGGYESLVMPFDPREVRSVTKWEYPGPCFRVHAGLEAIEDLIADMDAGFARLRRSL